MKILVVADEENKWLWEYFNRQRSSAIREKVILERYLGWNPEEHNLGNHCRSHSYCSRISWNYETRMASVIILTLTQEYTAYFYV